MCVAASHNITLRSPLCFVCPVLSAAPCYSCLTHFVLPLSCYVLCCLKHSYLCAALLILLLLLFCPALSAAHVITDQISKFRIPGGLDAHWLISTYQLRARPTSVAIGGNCVCVLSSLECNLYRLLVASLTAGLNIVPITEKFSVMSRESSRGNVSGYCRNLGSLRAGTRHHGGRRVRCSPS